MIEQAIALAAALGVTFQMKPLIRSWKRGTVPGYRFTLCLPLLLVGGALAAAFTDQATWLTALLAILALATPSAARGFSAMIEQRDILRARAQDLSRNLDKMDDSATSRIASGESKFRDLAAVVPVGIFETDMDDNLIYVNNLMGKMTGLGARKTRIEGFRQAIHPEDREIVQNEWDLAIRNRTVFERVFRFIGQDTEPIWVVCLSHPRRVNGHYAGHVGMFMDVTERKRQDTAQKELEEQTKRADRYESLGVLASGVAHDFNNLLVPILGGADRLVKELPADSPLHQLAVELENAANQAANLSTQMLAFSGAMPTGEEEVILSELIDGMKENLERKNDGKAGITYEESGDASQPLSSSPAQLSNVMRNLFDNALDAVSETGGKITIRYGTRSYSKADLAETMLGREVQPGNLPFFEIEDNGEGIAPDSLKRIFDPFFSTRFTGRGLGLAVVSGIAKKLRAAILVKSAVDDGTCVTMVLPNPATEVETGTPADDSDRENSRKNDGRILVIDDEPAVREFVEAMLRANNYDCLTAVDGIDGIEVFRREQASIAGVILDLTMPRMDGEEVLDHLLSIQPDLAVLITSGFAESDVMTRLADRATCGFLSKPFRESDLIDGVSKMVQRPQDRKNGLS